VRDTIQQLVNGIFTGSIYALFALGYTLVFGVLDVLNLAHSEVFMLGAVTTYSLVALHHVPFALAVPIGIVAAGLLGLVIEFVALRPLRRRNAPPPDHGPDLDDRPGPDLRRAHRTSQARRVA
jgi:branched-chain amino acid transport system permease protein